MTTPTVPRPHGPRRSPEVRTAPEPAGLRRARALSVALVVLMAVSAAAGLLLDGAYRDPEPVAAMLRGYDLVALLVAVPLLAVTLLPAARHSARAQLVWVGMLAYAVYDYAIYVFGTAFNDLFLVHTALFSLSVFALALALANLDANAIAARFRARTPVRPAAAILMLLAVGLGAMWVVNAVRFAITGAPAAESLLVLPAAHQHLGYVLDLALLVPASVLAAVLLWRRAGWGYLLGAPVAVFGAVYQLNYVAALLFQARAGVPGASAFDPQEPAILAAYLLAAGLLLGGVRGGRVDAQSHV